jgi:Domain found in Dishevelled, Egl-10, and Pleckstrin (DEP)/Phosphatidylinositol 3- and 4-kinase
MRLLLLLGHPGYSSFWRVKVVYRAQPYQVAWANLSAMIHGDALDGEAESDNSSNRRPSSSGVLVHGVSSIIEGGSSPLAQRASRIITPSKVAENWLVDDAALWRFAVSTLFAKGPGGVAMRTHKRRLRVIQESFLASELVDIIMEHANFASRVEAVDVAQRLQNAKLITRIGSVLGRHAQSSHKDFTDSDKLYVSKVHLHKSDSDHACIVTDSGEPVLCWKEFGSGPERGPVRSVELKIPCDQIDLQSRHFWSEAVFVQNPAEGQSLGHIAVVHPCIPEDWEIMMAAAVDSDSESLTDTWSVGDPTPDKPPSPPPVDDSEPDAFVHKSSAMSMSAVSEAMLEVGGSSVAHCKNLASNGVVKHVFSSIARPFIMELRRLSEDGDINDDRAYQVVGKSLLCKEGDNLGQDLCVESMFRLFNLIWSESRDIFPVPARAPFAVSYDVFPTSAKQGFMEALSGLKSFKEFDWDNWIATRGHDKDAITRMIASAAGSYVAAYILSIGDRHTENVQIQDNLTFVHIDFGFVLNSAPPIDGVCFIFAAHFRCAFALSAFLIVSLSPFMSFLFCYYSHLLRFILHLKTHFAG